jgi:hypothetical protein
MCATRSLLTLDIATLPAVSIGGWICTSGSTTFGGSANSPLYLALFFLAQLASAYTAEHSELFLISHDESPFLNAFATEKFGGLNSDAVSPISVAARVENIRDTAHRRCKEATLNLPGFLIVEFASSSAAQHSGVFLNWRSYFLS